MIDRTQLLHFTAKLVTNILEHYRDKVLGTTLRDICAQHRSKTNADHYIMGTNVFLAEGKIVPITHVRFNAQAIRLHEDLIDDHNTYWHEYQDYQHSSERISQSLRSITARAETWQDLRDMLPDYVLSSMLHEPVMEGLSRTRPDVFAGNPDHPDYEKRLAERLLHWDPVLINMYARVGGTISVYLGYKFL